MKLALPLLLMCLAGAACAGTVQDLESELLQEIREMVGDPQQDEDNTIDTMFPYTAEEDDDTPGEDNTIDPISPYMAEEDEADDATEDNVLEPMPEFLEDEDQQPDMENLEVGREVEMNKMDEMEKRKSLEDCSQVTSMVVHLTSMVDTVLSRLPVYGDCAVAKASGETESWVYTLGAPLYGVQVWCDMDTDGAGWTVIQRRFGGSVLFNRNWEEYKQGFGNKYGEYWLGNENIHILTEHKNYMLRIDMTDWEGGSRFAEYSTFRVSGESHGYRLTIDGYSGDAGDSMSGVQSNNGQQFSTVDRDNDGTSGSCSETWGQGGWWFKSCSASLLNGRYLGNCADTCARAQGVVWYHWRGWNYSLKSVSMKIRPVLFVDYI